jgi:hypothetical protein
MAYYCIICQVDEKTIVSSYYMFGADAFEAFQLSSVWEFKSNIGPFIWIFREQ